MKTDATLSCVGNRCEGVLGTNTSAIFCGCPSVCLLLHSYVIAASTEVRSGSSPAANDAIGATSDPFAATTHDTSWVLSRADHLAEGSRELCCVCDCRQCRQKFVSKLTLVIVQVHVLTKRYPFSATAISRRDVDSMPRSRGEKSKARIRRASLTWSKPLAECLLVAIDHGLQVMETALVAHKPLPGNNFCYGIDV